MKRTDTPSLFRHAARWAERHAYELFIAVLVLVICELIVFSAVPKP